MNSAPSVHNHLQECFTGARLSSSGVEGHEALTPALSPQMFGIKVSSENFQVREALYSTITFMSMRHKCVMFRLTELLNPNLRPESESPGGIQHAAVITADFNMFPAPMQPKSHGVEYLPDKFPFPVHAEIASALCTSDPDSAAEAVRLHKKASCKKKEESTSSHLQH